MMYRSYEDLSDCIRRNVWKVPADVDLIVGVPRSGMIPALMLAELLNMRCADIDTFIEGKTMATGSRSRLMRSGDIRKVLVLDDTVFFGRALRKAKEKLEPISDKYELIYATIYAEGKHAKEMVDIYFEEIYRPGETVWLYEWNILHHYEKKTRAAMWDIDGLLCKDPPDDRDIESYEKYLPDAIPMIIPTTHVGALVTYRLEKYRDVTEKWLEKHGVDYGELKMFDAPDRNARNQTLSPSRYKAMLYSEAAWATLFIESEVRQAERIFQYSGKPVFCYANGKMYK